jgi:hypothetical protein
MHLGAASGRNGSGGDATSKGTKTHGRIGCRCLATGIDTTDSSVEQHPEVDCSRSRAIAQTPVWSALGQQGRTTGSKASSPTGFGLKEPRKTPMQQSRAASEAAQATNDGRSRSSLELERAREEAAMNPGLVHIDGTRSHFGDGGFFIETALLGSRPPACGRSTQRGDAAGEAPGERALASAGASEADVAKTCLPTCW